MGWPTDHQKWTAVTAQRSLAAYELYSTIFQAVVAIGILEATGIEKRRQENLRG